MLGKIEGRRRRGCQRLRWLNGITDAMDMNLGKLWEMIERPGMLQSRIRTESDTNGGLKNNNQHHALCCFLRILAPTRCMLQGTSCIQLCAHVQDFCRMNSQKWNCWVQEHMCV